MLKFKRAKSSQVSYSVLRAAVSHKTHALDIIMMSHTNLAQNEKQKITEETQHSKTRNESATKETEGLIKKQIM